MSDDNVRPELSETLDRRRALTDEARPQATARRSDAGRLTARAILDLLADEAGLVEYGGLALAGQRNRYSDEELALRTPADGIITAIGPVNAVKTAVAAYDYTVLAGTQGVVGHRKLDRLLGIAKQGGLPVVLFAEGGGGRPSDSDFATMTGLHLPTFASLAQIRAPRIGIGAGYCFAGNAALLATCDVTIGVAGANIGMGGPAMVASAGLGPVSPTEIGPLQMHLKSGAIDIAVADDAESVTLARVLVALLTGAAEQDFRAADQLELRHLIPDNRRRAYDVRTVITGVLDTSTFIETKAAHGRAMVTGLGRLAGNAIGVIANNPMHGAGAIDAAAARKASAMLGLCARFSLPVVSFCDTPGIMVGPHAEEAGLVSAIGALFNAGAQLTAPQATVILRKGYGLGAMAMAGGGFHESRVTVAWPTGEVGAMGLEGAVELAYAKELGELGGDQRAERFDSLVAEAYAHGKALAAAPNFEFDDVIDPADTRNVLVSALF